MLYVVSGVRAVLAKLDVTPAGLTTKLVVDGIAVIT